MDELKDKLGSLFKPKAKKAGFKGQGHRLGTADPAQPQGRPAAQASTSSQPQRPTLQQPHASSSRVDPRQELKPATEFSPFTAVIGGGAACTTSNMNPAASSPANDHRAAAGQQRGSSQPQPPPQPQQEAAAAPVVRAEVSTAVLEELQHCLALISSQPEAAVGSMEVLQKLLSNLLTAPQEAKFRQLRLGPDPNPKIQSSVLAVSGALDLLKACGFEVHADSQDGGTFAFFLDDAKLSYVEAGLLQLQLVLSSTQEAQQQHSQGQQSQQQPAQAAAPATSSSNTSAGATLAPQQPPPAQPVAPTPAPAPAAQPPVARNTLVLLPAAPDADVPDWFFQRTAAEVKAEFTALLRRRQTQQVVASKAWKDLKLGAGGSSSSAGSKRPSQVTLRVRFPEGVCLQGCFGVREPVTAVFDWVTGSLRYPGLTYELITPSRSPLGPKGSVGAADLAGAVLHFRGLSHTQRGGYLVGEGGRQLPFLSDGLLAHAQAD